jgi:beta-lactamase superfamily II metal-dependent hydrolase
MPNLVRSLLLLLTLLTTSATAKDLKIYFIDVEGGQCTLIVTPKGESILVDTGWPGFNGRDADRIQAQAKKAKIKQIDWLIITHYHTDHVGGITLLTDRMKVLNLVSHGRNTETGKAAEKLQAQYDEAKANAKELIVKPGDILPIKDVEIEVITSRGAVIDKPAKLSTGAADNPLCANATQRPKDEGENARSVGFLLKFGNFRFLDLADITWNTETQVACPANKVGHVDLYLTNHHGLTASNNPVHVHALQAKAIVMNNGDKKGGEAAAIDWMRQSPGLKDFWQLHYSIAAGKDHNAPDPYIANLTAPGGFHLEVTAKKDGAFTILNQRNKFTKTY